VASSPLAELHDPAGKQKPAAGHRRVRRRRLPPGMVRARTAAAWCSVGLRTWRSWDAAGLVPRPVRIGGCVLWSVATLRRWRDASCPPRAEFERLQALDRR
jgi:hypothetical protein